MQNDPTFLRIFEGRTHSTWADRPVSERQIRALYDLVKFGPTSLNSSPARFYFVVSPAAKGQLANCVRPGNQRKVRSAPCVAIIATDEMFYEEMPYLFPSREGVRETLAADPVEAARTAFRNGTLQGAYLIFAARALGLDCGPMSGFDNKAVDQQFFAGTTLRSNFLCAIGYAEGQPHPRAPRLPFERAAKII